jgi:type II secretory pathway pseudopilin PulG
MQFHRNRTRAFTLVELMISLGIALLLIYGVNLVFRAVTDIIKTGNALSSATRRMRGIDSMLTSDFEGQARDRKREKDGIEYTPDQRETGILSITDIPRPSVGIPITADVQARQPAITMFCKRQVAFLNKTDEEADTDKDPATFDEDDNGSEIDPGENFTAAPTFPRLNRRVHRVDTVSFFAAGTFIPKAGRFGTAGTLYQNIEPFPEAWIWYGHCMQPGGVGTTAAPLLTNFTQTNPAGLPSPGIFYQPGQADDTSAGMSANPNTRNKYAVDWVLGRMAMCINWRDPGALGAGIYPGIMRTNKTSYQAYGFFAESAALPTAIGFGAQDVRANGSGTGSTFTGTLPDLMPVDPTPMSPPAGFNSSLNDVVGVAQMVAGDSTTFSPSGSFGVGSVYVPANAKGLLKRYGDLQTASPAWWQPSTLQPMLTSPPGSSPLPLRFNALTSVADPVGINGQITPREKSALLAPFLASGCSNFIVEFAGDFVTQDNNPTSASYGNVTSASGTIAPDGIVDFNVLGGVRQTQWYGLPRDIDGDGLAAASTTTGQAGGDVVTVFQKAKATAVIAGSFEKAYIAGDSYVVAFGPNDMYVAPPAIPIHPSMIRLTVNLVDAGGNLADGLAREFVFKVR